jgi:hypothetical protein
LVDTKDIDMERMATVIDKELQKVEYDRMMWTKKPLSSFIL